MEGPEAPHTPLSDPVFSGSCHPGERPAEKPQAREQVPGGRSPRAGFGRHGGVWPSPPAGPSPPVPTYCGFQAAWWVVSTGGSPRGLPAPASFCLWLVPKSRRQGASRCQGPPARDQQRQHPLPSPRLQLLCPGALGGSWPDGVQTSLLQPTLPRPAWESGVLPLMLSPTNRQGLQGGGQLRGWVGRAPCPEQVLEGQQKQLPAPSPWQGPP